MHQWEKSERDGYSMHNGLSDCARQQRRPIHLLNLDWQDCAVFSEAAFDADDFGLLG